MPLIDIRKLPTGSMLGLWRMTENPDDFYRCCQPLSVYRVEVDTLFRSDSRKKEFLAIRALLYEMFPGKTLTIGHEPSGKPTLSDGNYISISHTKGYAALAVSGQEEVAVDIEYFSDRVSKIAHKFIREDEKASDVRTQLINWSAKETVFKYFSADQLDYFDMKMHPLEDEEADSGILMMENMKRGVSSFVHYEVNEAFVLTYIL